jgi:hypothetical protein
LAHILRAAQSENVRWVGAISREILGLSDVLREVFKNYSWHVLFGKARDKLGGNRFIILADETILNQESVEVNMLGVGSLTQSLTDGGLTGRLWTKDTHGLWNDGSFGLSKN